MDKGQPVLPITENTRDGAGTRVCTGRCLDTGHLIMMQGLWTGTGDTDEAGPRNRAEMGFGSREMGSTMTG